MLTQSMYRAAVSVFLGMMFMLAGNAVYAQEMPVTTQSDEARKAFIEGRTMVENYDWQGARDKFDEALKADPEFALAHIFRSFTAENDQIRDNHLEKALALKNNVSRGERLLIEAIKADQEMKIGSAVSSMKNAVESHPDDKFLHIMLAWYAGRDDQADLALSQYEQAVKIDPDYSIAYNLMGYLYMEKGSYNKAEQVLQKNIDMHPEDANGYDSMADLYSKMGRFGSAIRFYEKSLNINPDFYWSQKKIGDNLVFEGKFNEGVEAYRQAYDRAQTPVDKFWIQVAWANAPLYSDNYKEALAEGDKLIKMTRREQLDNLETWVYIRNAAINIYNDQLPAAQSNLRAAERLLSKREDAGDPGIGDRHWYFINAAHLAIHQDKFDEARDIIERLNQQAKETDHPDFEKNYRMMMGMLKYGQGDYEGAIRELNQSDTELPHVLYHLALCYREQDKKAEARKFFGRVADFNANTLEYAILRNRSVKASTGDIIGLEEN